MAIIDMPRSLACARGCSLVLVHSDAATRSDPSGAIQARSYGVPVWSLTLVAPRVLDDDQAGAWKAMALRLRGLANHLQAFDATRPVPLGTLRGALSLAAPAGAGAGVLQVAASVGQVGATVKPGDLFQLGAGLGTSQLVMAVSAGVVGLGNTIEIEIEPPLRQAHAGGTAVVWDHPRAYMRRTEPSFGWQAYNTLWTQSMSISLIESP